MPLFDLLPRRTLCALIVFGWGIFPTGTSAKLNLERITPVAADQVVPVVDFLRPSMFEQPKLNPGGTHVAAITSGGTEQTQLMVHDLKTGESQLVADLGGMDIINLNWLNDERLVFFGISVKTDQGFFCAVNVSSLGIPYPLVQNGEFSLVGVPMDDRTRPLAYVRAGDVTDPKGEVAVIDTGVETAEIVQLSKTHHSAQDNEKIQRQNNRIMLERFPFLDFGTGHHYASDGVGNLAYATVWVEGWQQLHLWDGKAWQRSPADLEKLMLHGSGADGGEMIVSDLQYDGQPSAVRVMNIKTGELGPELLRDPGYDFTGWVVRDPGTRKIVGFDYQRSTPAMVWIDEGYQALHDTFKGSFPGKVVRIASVDESANVFVLQVFSDRHPSSYHVVNLAERTMGPLKDSRPWLDAARLSRVHNFKFKTAEGHKLDAYLTLPKGVSKTAPGPMVVLPHSGSSNGRDWVRTSTGYNPIAQFLASRGYIVLQPNYRGSPGTNWMFPEADQWDYLKMRDDVIAATKTAIRTKLVDPGRVAIMGERFGANLALACAVEAPDLYQGTIGIDGFYDWVEVMQDAGYNQHSNPNYNRWVAKLGSPKAEAAKYAAISPVNHVANLTSPVLVLQGQDAPAFYRHEGRRLIAALRKHDVPHDSLFTDRDGFGAYDVENRVKLYERLESFLRENL